MKKILLTLVLATTFIGCDQDNSKKSPTGMQAQNDQMYDPMANTPMKQLENGKGMSDMDMMLTQKIRQAIKADKSLSMSAKNIKITSMNGVVTLQGSVANSQEMSTITQILAKLPGIKSVDNQLVVTSSSY